MSFVMKCTLLFVSAGQATALPEYSETTVPDAVPLPEPPVPLGASIDTKKVYSRQTKEMVTRGEEELTGTPFRDVPKAVEVAPEPKVQPAEADYTSTRGEQEKAEPAPLRQPAPQPKVQIARDQNDELRVLSKRILREVLRDPFAVTCGLLALGYLVQAMLGKTKTKSPWQPSDERAIDQSSNCPTQISRRSSSTKTPKSQFAISLNQKIMRLHNADEVLEFALANTLAGRTDIVNVVTAIHRSAKLASGGARKRIANDPRVTQLLDALHGFLQDKPPLGILSRAVGNTSWALAKLQFADDGHPVLESLEAAFVEHAQGFRPEELMNTVWAFAELRGEAKREGQARALNVARAAVGCSDKFPEFTLQQVVYFAWALARLSQIAAVRNASDVRSGLLSLQGLIFERVASEVQLLNTKNLAMVCWAVAHVHSKVGGNKEQVNELLKKIGGHVLETRDLEAFFPGEIASILWALNKVHVDFPQFFHRFRSHVLKHGLQGYNSQDIANITCAYVNTKTGDDEIFLALADAANARASTFNRSERMMMHWAFTQLPHLPAPRLAGN